MNVTFHTIGSIAASAVLSFSASEKWRSFSAAPKYLIGFAAGILLHGVLDFLPHEYPLTAKVDVIFALILLTATIFFSQKQNRLLILICFIGSIFPDVIDLSPAIINKYSGIHFPQPSFKIFPCHWKEYSGSIYDGSRRTESNIYHLALLLICSVLIYFYRKNLIKFSDK